MAAIFQAKYRSKCAASVAGMDCPVHGGWIEIGDTITWIRKGPRKGRTYHRECWEQLKCVGAATEDEEKSEVSSSEAANAFEPARTPDEIYNSGTLGATNTGLKPLASVTRSNASGASQSDPLTKILVDSLLPAIEAKISVKVDAADVRKIVEESVKDYLRPTEVHLHQAEEVSIKDMGLQHEKFSDLLKVCNTRMPDGHRLNAWVAGPAGTGKTTAARKVAEALDVPFLFTGAIDNEYKLSGFVDAQGRIVSTAFKQAYRDGGVFLFDEIDASLPNAVLPFNAASANGHAAFPEGVIDRHKDCILIAAANTFGHGGTSDYVGRLKQDAAVLDRFVFIEWPIDEKLEASLSTNEQWLKRVRAVRAKVAEKGVKILVTPRATMYGQALLASGLSQSTVEAMVLRKGMTDAQWDMVR